MSGTTRERATTDPGLYWWASPAKVLPGPGSELMCRGGGHTLRVTVTGRAWGSGEKGEGLSIFCGDKRGAQWLRLVGKL